METIEENRNLLLSYFTLQHILPLGKMGGAGRSLKRSPAEPPACVRSRMESEGGNLSPGKDGWGWEGIEEEPC